MDPGSRSLYWKAGLAASLLANIALFVMWLGAINAAPAESENSPETVIVVVTATTGALAQLPATPTGEAQDVTVEASPTPSPQATATSQPTSTPPPTETPLPLPTDTPQPTPTATEPAIPTPSWLGYLNRFREEGGLPPLQDETVWSLGSEAHSRYTVKTDFVTHSQDTTNPWYSQEGADAARNGNLAATVWFEAPPEWAIDYWITAPFHALPILDPQLTSVGFGWYREQDGGIVFAANMDILRGLDQDLIDIEYPIMFPTDGGQTWVRQSVLFEWPDPMTACPGYVRPTGAPIMLQVGTGRGTPVIGGSSFRSGDQVLDHCVFGETNYVNPDAAAQQSGRRILDVRDAIVLIPRSPLTPDREYTASVVVDGQQITWSFMAVAGP